MQRFERAAARTRPAWRRRDRESRPTGNRSAPAAPRRNALTIASACSAGSNRSIGCGVPPSSAQSLISNKKMRRTSSALSSSTSRRWSVTATHVSITYEEPPSSCSSLISTSMSASDGSSTSTTSEAGASAACTCSRSSWPERSTATRSRPSGSGLAVASLAARVAVGSTVAVGVEGCGSLDWQASASRAAASRPASLAPACVLTCSAAYPVLSPSRSDTIGSSPGRRDAASPRRLFFLRRAQGRLFGGTRPARPSDSWGLCPQTAGRRPAHRTAAEVLPPRSQRH